jgi:hypothetical protein
MKKIMIVLVTVMLLFSVAVLTPADAKWKLYGEYMPYGQWDYLYSGSSTSTDNSAYWMSLLGSQFSVNRFKIVLEYGSGLIQGDPGYSDAEMNIYEARCGFSIVQGDRVKIDLTGGGLIIDAATAEFYHEGIMVGVDGAVMLSDKFTIDAGFEYGILNSFIRYYPSSYPDPTDVYILEGRIKVNYIISNHFALSAGYRSYNTTNYYGYTDELAMNTLSGLTIGAALKF